MKKLFYIILIIALIGGGVYAWFYFSKPVVQNNSAQNPPNDALPPAQAASQQIPADYSIADTFPKTDAISIGTPQGMVEVKNFYKAVVDTEEGMVIMRNKDNNDGSASLTAGNNDDNYELIYDRNTSKFFVYLKAVEAKQAEAESDLLDILGIGQQEACKLDVSVITAGERNSSELSFCAK